MEHGQPYSQPYSQNQFQRSNLFNHTPGHKEIWEWQYLGTSHTLEDFSVITLGSRMVSQKTSNGSFQNLLGGGEEVK